LQQAFTLPHWLSVCSGYRPIPLQDGSARSQVSLSTRMLQYYTHVAVLQATNLKRSPASLSQVSNWSKKIYDILPAESPCCTLAMASRHADMTSVLSGIASSFREISREVRTSPALLFSIHQCKPTRLLSRTSLSQGSHYTLILIPPPTYRSRSEQAEHQLQN
jgi:hypothetical protein